MVGRSLVSVCVCVCVCVCACTSVCACAYTQYFLPLRVTTEGGICTQTSLILRKSLHVHVHVTLLE